MVLIFTQRMERVAEVFLVTMLLVQVDTLQLILVRLHQFCMVDLVVHNLLVDKADTGLVPLVPILMVMLEYLVKVVMEVELV